MDSKARVGLKRVLINIGITIVVGLIYFYVRLPAINLHNTGFYGFVFVLAAVYCLLTGFSMGVIKSSSDPKTLWKGLKQFCLVPLIICAALALIYVVGSLISSPIIRASAYTKLLPIVNSSFVEDVEEVSYDQIPMLDEASAMKLGDRKLGELADMVSQFEVADNYTQINYRNRPVRVTPLRYGDLIKWFNNRSEGLPAYIIIDMVTQKVDVVRLSEGMKYSDAEHFGRNIYRYLRFKYPTFMFDRANFEIDEDGIPYWVCPKLEKTIGLFGGTDINGAVLVNAITGESRYYAADEVPTWVDRVYIADLLIEQYDYYGRYINGFINSLLGQKGVTQTTDGYNYIAMNDDVYMYTGITSAGADQSNIGFILVNQRTKQATYYSIAGAEEYSAMSSAQGVVQDLGYRSTFPLLLNISSQPTYFMALKDGAGLVKAYAMVNVQQYQIVATGPTVASCEKNYLDLMIQHGLITKEEVEQYSESGEVAEIRTAVLSGTSYYYVRLEGDSYYYVISAAESEEVVIIDVGDRVTVDYTGTEGSLRPAYKITRD
ncbi:MAG: CvpA family protein [Clostridiales bacterium]|jgi:hypothetical protein|nr:CvpA family protein [Clostridiales bacterium]